MNQTNNPELNKDEALRMALVSLHLPLNDLPYYEAYIKTGKAPKEALEENIYAVAKYPHSGLTFANDLIKAVYKHHPELDVFKDEEVKRLLGNSPCEDNEPKE